MIDALMLILCIGYGASLLWGMFLVGTASLISLLKYLGFDLTKMKTSDVTLETSSTHQSNKYLPNFSSTEQKTLSLPLIVLQDSDWKS